MITLHVDGVERVFKIEDIHYIKPANTDDGMHSHSVIVTPYEMLMVDEPYTVLLGILNLH